MTKKEAAVIKKYNLMISEMNIKKREQFILLQEMAREVGLPAYCNAESNFTNLTRYYLTPPENQKMYKLVLDIYVKYEVYSGKYDVLMDLARDIQFA